jgi:hypothetical protein
MSMWNRRPSVDATTFSSLATAFDTLFTKLEIPTDIAKLHEYFETQPQEVINTESVWGVPAGFEQNIHLLEVGHYGTWPNTNNAVVKFQYQSLEEPYIEIDGNKQANIIAHYCVVSDYGDHLIIDTSDGVVKNSNQYGLPVSWASYSRETSVSAVEIPEVPEPASQFKSSKYKPGDTYIWQDGDNIWDVARMMGCHYKNLMEYNGMETPDELEPGIALHVPVKSLEPASKIEYEVLPEAVPMHVSKSGGAKKWSFGNVKTWEDVNSSGFFPENTNIHIVAIAHVPIAEKDGSKTEAAYYMDANSLGDYRNSGRVTYTIGYNWSDLTEGHVSRVAKPAAVVEEAIIEQVVEAPAEMEPEALELKKAEFRELIAKDAADNPDKYPNYYKTSYQPLEPAILCTTMLPEGMEYVWVKDYDGKGRDRKLHQHQEITIGGTFEKDQAIYGRPSGVVASGFWYGIPMGYLTANTDLYNTYVDAPTRAENHGSLTWSERLFTVPFAWAVNHRVVKRIRLNRKNKNNKKEQ